MAEPYSRCFHAAIHFSAEVVDFNRFTLFADHVKHLPFMQHAWVDFQVAL